MAVSQKLYVTQSSQDVAKNVSKVRILWQSTQSGDSYNSIERTAYYYVAVNGGSEVKYSVKYTLPSKTTKTIIDVTIEVQHENDGRGSVEVRTWMDTRISAGVVQLSKSLTLTSIPRASSIGATDADIGSTSSIVVTKRSANYTHSIYFVFGKQTGYIKADGSIASTEVKLSETSIAFTLPDSFYKQIPDDPSGVCTLTCTTYLDSTQIGQATVTTFRAVANRMKCLPLVSGAVEDINEDTIALTGDSSVLIRYKSNALCTIVAVPKNGATIEGKKIEGVKITENTKTFTNINKDSIAFYAVDSRGYSKNTIIPLNLVEYVKLSARVSFTRDDPTSGNATLKVIGNCFSGSFGLVDNSLTIRYKIKKEGEDFGYYTNVPVTPQDNSYEASVALSGLNYEHAYTVQVAIADALTTRYVVATVSRGIPVFDWGNLDFRFNVPVLITAESYGTSYPENPKKGQIFYLKNEGAGYTIRIYDGNNWT